MELISIIIPCFNYGWALAETLSSVLAQTYQQWECIVVNDGSQDDTEQVARSFIKRDKRFKYIYQTNTGVSRARNNGLQHARGTYIQFLDADDLLADRKLEVHLNYLLQNPQVDLVYGPVKYFDNGCFGSFRESLDKSLIPWMPKVSGKGYGILFRLVKSNIMVIQSPLIKKASLDKTGHFKEGMRYNEDWYLWIKFALAGMHMVYDDAVEGLSYVRVHETSASYDNIKMVIGEREMRLLLRTDLASKIYVDIAQYNMDRLIELSQRLGSMYFNDKKFRKGIELFLYNARVTGSYLENLKHILHYLKRGLINLI
ncbi:glycosyltransferase family 2 protein [Hymenobacter crusticola]|uniref:Glycosyltransferase 2-like domain-containing protein n=1 Tax=Hymenobacter crusticola TaxID=1770526 RepID=A0A243WCM8_9BACT|nr:glycosyltransferase family 2 protein [Hymenobacter crusticola]OUJ73155.1 hypothetical protein BXP70_15110 [Hymenobacter crusticola]